MFGGAPRARMDTAANAIARARDIIAEDVYVDPARSHSPPKPRAEAHPAADANGREVFDLIELTRVFGPSLTKISVTLVF